MDIHPFYYQQFFSTSQVLIFWVLLFLYYKTKCNSILVVTGWHTITKHNWEPCVFSVHASEHHRMYSGISSDIKIHYEVRKINNSQKYTASRNNGCHDSCVKKTLIFKLIISKT